MFPIFSLVALISVVFAFRRYKFEIVVEKLLNSLLAAVIMGGCSFALGFFGPKILTPDSVEGPLLGILLTGPLGALFGIVLGWVYPKIRFLNVENPGFFLDQPR